MSGSALTEPIETRWIVISGPPSSGKTTTLDWFGERGEIVSQDSTRRLLAQVAAEGRDLEEFRFAEDFQPRVLEAMEAAEGLLDPNQRSFLEYALPCNIAFHRTESLALTAGLSEAASRYRYEAVVLLDPLPWTSDAERVEDAEYQVAVHRHMIEVYTELGYDPIRIEAMDPERRFDVIVERLGLDI